MSSLFHDDGEPSSGRKIFLATVAYDSPDASYVFAIARTREALHKAGLPTSYYLLSGYCHVDDARNKAVRDFLDSDCSDLIFLDADVSWEPEHLIELCRHDYDITGGVYPYRRETGKEGMPVRMLPGMVLPDENGRLEVAGLPAGFMRIRRRVLEKMTKRAPIYKDAARGYHDIPLLFERRVSNGERMGGDINFCHAWREMGGEVHAVPEMTLGHCGKQIIRGSLAASLRRQTGLSLRHVAELIRDEEETPDTYLEALRAVYNPWGAPADFLALSVLLARKSPGPIIEAGSGLTTLLMAAARPDITVWCLENSPFYAMQLEHQALSANLFNINIVYAPLRDGWYDLSEDKLPESFGLGLVDGPPRYLGDRMKFFDTFGDCVSAVLCDDADDPGYLSALRVWADTKGMVVEHDGRPAVILPANWQKAA